MSGNTNRTTTTGRADPPHGPAAHPAPDVGWYQHLAPARLIAWLLATVAQGRARMQEEPDAGYSTEAVLVTALLVVLAIAVIAIIAVKVTELANGITLG